MEYVIVDPAGGMCRYSVFLGADPRGGWEDYGVGVLRQTDGAERRVDHAAATPGEVDSLLDYLMDRQVEPEGLERAVRRWAAGT